MTKLIKVKNDDLTEVTQPVPTAVEFEEIASGSVELPVGTNKSIFLDSLDGEYKNIDSLGVVSPFGSGGGGGLQPVFIDHTSIPAELVRNRIYEADFSGAPVDSTLVVTFPEGTGSETFILGFRITGLSQGSTVTFVTTNTQDIFFPDATTDTTITGVNAKTYFEFAWDQTRFVYGDVDSPTFADLSASLGDVEVDTLTVGTAIIGGEATASQAGTVSTTTQTFAGDKTFQGDVIAEGFLGNTKGTGSVDNVTPFTILTIPTGIDIGYRVEIMALGGAGLSVFFVSAMVRQRVSGDAKASFIVGNNAFDLSWSGQDLQVTSTNASATSFMFTLTRIF